MNYDRILVGYNSKHIILPAKSVKVLLDKATYHYIEIVMAQLTGDMHFDARKLHTRVINVLRTIYLSFIDFTWQLQSHKNAQQVKIDVTSDFSGSHISLWKYHMSWRNEISGSRNFDKLCRIIAVMSRFRLGTWQTGQWLMSAAAEMHLSICV